MSDPVTLRTRKFLRNALLGRKQMVVYVGPLFFEFGGLVFFWRGVGVGETVVYGLAGRYWRGLFLMHKLKGMD